MRGGDGERGEGGVDVARVVARARVEQQLVRGRVRVRVRVRVRASASVRVRV